MCNNGKVSQKKGNKTKMLFDTISHNSLYYSGTSRLHVQHKDMVFMRDSTGCQMSWQSHNGEIGTQTKCYGSFVPYNH